MKKNRISKQGALVVTAIAFIAVLSGCSFATGRAEVSDTLSSPAAQTEALDGDKKTLKVMASFYPIYDFAVKIGGDRAQVTNMVPSGTEPHEWEPAATDLKNLEEADLFLYSGAGMEHWVEDVLKSLDNKELVTVEASGNLALRKEHTDEHAKEEQGHDHGGYDPHVWLNPMNAKKEMENIRDGFIEADPANRAYYEANYETYAAGFDELDRKYRETLSALPHKDIVVAHEAFGYLCDAYGLNQVGIEGLSPDSEPDPARMAEVIDFVRANGVKVIFFEELVSPKVAETIAKETGAATQVLNPLEGLSDEEQKSGADYFSVMEENLKQLEAALTQ